ncbi:MAG TPA: hypothetical protein VFX96_14295 [Pyrinomonadaceae bacterium]|nr:hypothetical protein [Pyrinomonadaceae bacterium]
MRRTVFHLVVALLAFLVGITTAYAFGLFFGAEKPRATTTSFGLRSGPPPARRACPSMVRDLAPPPPPVVMVMPSAPVPPDAPAPPPAPTRRAKKQTRIIIRSADGSVKVIESGVDARASRTESAPVTKF